jgi:hypothetical protein
MMFHSRQDRVNPVSSRYNVIKKFKWSAPGLDNALVDPLLFCWNCQLVSPTLVGLFYQGIFRGENPFIAKHGYNTPE